jgi:hypothetical protein
MNTLDKNLTQILKDLVAGHSYIAVHTELLRLMNDEYAALKTFFDVETPKKKRTHLVAQTQAQTQTQAQAQVQTQVQTQVPPALAGVESAQEDIPAKVLANTKIRIIKKAASPDETSTSTAPVEQKPRMDSKELKAWQKEQEAKKLAELTAAGTNPELLLTPESFKRWIEGEGRTFAYVAREYVGLPEATVADYAKSQGVKSKISKSRAILSAKNRRP